MAISSVLGSSALLPAGLGFRNVIINGNFDIWQRGTSFTTAANASYFADRVFARTAGTSINVDITQDTSVPNVRSKYSVKFQQKTSTATSVTEYGLRQYVEATVAQALYGRTVTVSFWYKSNKTGSHGIRIYGAYATGGGDFGTTFTVTTADTWEYKTITSAVPFAGITANNVAPTDIGALLMIGFTANSNGFSSVSANDYFQISQLQMEANTQPTPFEQRPIGVELNLCMRYYEKSYAYATAPGTSTSNGLLEVPLIADGSGFPILSFELKAPKRSSAWTMTFYRQDGTAGSWGLTRYTSATGTNNTMTYDNRSESNARIYNTTATAAAREPCRFTGHYVVSDEL